MAGYNGLGGFAQGLVAGAEVGNQIMQQRQRQAELDQQQQENDQQFGLNSAFQRLRQQALDDELQSSQQNRQFAAARQPYDLASAKAQAELVSPLGQAQLDTSRANVAHTNAVTASIPEELGLKRAYMNAQAGAMGAAAEQTRLENQGKRMELDQMEQQRQSAAGAHDALLNALDPARHHQLTDEQINRVNTMLPGLLDLPLLQSASWVGHIGNMSPEQRNTFLTSQEGKSHSLEALTPLLDRMANADGSAGNPYDIRAQYDLWHLGGLTVVNKRISDATYDPKRQGFGNVKVGMQLRADTLEQQQQVEHDVKHLQEKYKNAPVDKWSSDDRRRFWELERLSQGGTIEVERPLTMDRKAGGEPMFVPLESLVHTITGVTSVRNALNQSAYGQAVLQLHARHHGDPMGFQSALSEYNKQVRDAAVKAQERQQAANDTRLRSVTGIVAEDPEATLSDKLRVLEEFGMGFVRPRSPWAEDFLRSKDLVR